MTAKFAAVSTDNPTYRLFYPEPRGPSLPARTMLGLGPAGRQGLCPWGSIFPYTPFYFKNKFNVKRKNGGISN
jgi:hypothetical protein